MLELTDARTGARVALGRRSVTLAAGADDLGTILAVDTARRVAQVLGARVLVSGVPGGLEHLGIRPGQESGEPDVVLRRPWAGAEPPYTLEDRYLWLGGSDLPAARRRVAAWGEEPSRPPSADVQREVLAALCDDLDTALALDALGRSLQLGLPAGCLFETWVWADRLLAVDLARDVGR